MTLLMIINDGIIAVKLLPTIIVYPKLITGLFVFG